MLTVGLTGGIGSGKSLVGRVFETLNIPVFRADDHGRIVLDTDPEVKAAVRQLIGEEAYKNDRADRKFIAGVVFKNEEKLSALNRVIHPAVGRAFEAWKTRQAAPYCIREAAILFESGTYADCHRVICVTAPEALRLERVMKRDAVSEADVKARMAKQMPQEEKEERSDFVIHNDGLQAVIPQVVLMNQELRQSE